MNTTSEATNARASATCTSATQRHSDPGPVDLATDVDPDEHVTERVLERLRRIKQLNESGSTQSVLNELRALVVDAHEWARLEGDERARAAVDYVADAFATGSEVRAPALSAG